MEEEPARALRRQGQKLFQCVCRPKQHFGVRPCSGMAARRRRMIRGMHLCCTRWTREKKALCHVIRPSEEGLEPVDSPN